VPRGKSRHRRRRSRVRSEGRAIKRALKSGIKKGGKTGVSVKGALPEKDSHLEVEEEGGVRTDVSLKRLEKKCSGVSSTALRREIPGTEAVHKE